MVDGQLGGPTKYPALMGRIVISGAPLPRLRLTVGGGATTRIKQAIAREAQFEGIVGTDGQTYSSRPAGEFDTRDLSLDASAAYNLTERWRLGLTGTNLLDRRGYRPGSVLVPYLADGRRLILDVSLLF